MERRGGVARRDGRAGGQGDRAGIQPGLHPHDADAGFRIPRHDRPLDRRRPPPARQQRGVKVETAMARRIQHRLRQEEAIGHHHRHIGVQRGQSLAVRRIAKVQRGADLQPQFRSSRTHGRRAFLSAAPGAARRLGVDGGDIVACVDQRIQRRNREVRRSHENDAHQPRFLSLAKRSRTILRFIRLSRSTKTMPFRWSI